MKRKHHIKTKILSAILLAILLLSNISATAASTESWTTLAPMSTARYGFQTEVVNGKIYAIGGHNESTYFSSTEVYDPSMNTWTTLAPMSTARYEFQSEVIDGKIYAIGGHNESTYFSSTEVYDPSMNTWTTLAPMSTARYGFRTEVVNGKIYAIGGGSGASYLSSTEVYDPSMNTWTTLAPMLTGRSYFQTEVISGKIYAIGGGSGASYLSSTEVYDPSMNTWTTLAPMSTGRSYFQAEVISGKIYAIGGRNPAYLSSTEIYDPTTNTWTTLSPMSTVRGPFQPEVIDGKIYAIGGNAKYTYLSSTEIYDPTTNTWTTLAPMSTGRSYFQTEVIGRKIYAIGGRNSNGATISTAECYTAVTSISNVPTNLSATVGDSKVSLSWNLVSDATSYSIKRATTPGGIYTTISNGVTSTSYTDTDVTNGTTYYYVVTAISNGEESANSNEASATPSSTEEPTRIWVKIKVGKEINLRVVALPDEIDLDSAVWSSSNSSIAAVNSNGVVTGVSAGTSIVTVKTIDGTFEKNIGILVDNSKVEDLRIEVKVQEGKTVELIAANSDGTIITSGVIWTSSDTTVATIDSTGMVTGQVKGLSLVTATTTDGTFIGNVYIRVLQN